MKKRIIILLILCILVIPINTKAKTLSEYKNELNAKENEYKNKENDIKLNEAEQEKTKGRITEIYVELETAEKEIIDLNNDIARLNEEIGKKDKEIKEIIRYYQISNGESAYLEYLFSAKSITDFIYRATITEQMSKYNTKLINDMHAMITTNNENIKKVQAKEDSLKSLREELNQKIAALQSAKVTLTEESISLEEEVKAAKEVVDYYKSQGCKDDQDVSSCANKQLPPGTKFWRPVISGYVTSEYGRRVHPITGKVGSFHSGIDLSVYKSCGTTCLTLYSITNGKVVYTGYNSSMGNYIVMNHLVNGKNYSSIYMHMSKIYVNKGDVVNKDTVVGLMGNTGSSTATHLHLTMLSCLYLTDSKCKYPGNTVNPRDYINFPSGLYNDFTNRTNYYN